MNYFNNLSNSQKQLLINMGIYNDKDMPVEFFEKIRSLNDDLNEAELYCVSDYYKPYCYDSFLNLDKLIGTDHDKYKNKSWIEAFSILSRGEEIASLYLQNPTYYDNKDFSKIDMGVVEKNGSYYIFNRNGGGNNRLITLKIISIIQKNRGINILTPLVRFRRVPSIETCENIFFCEFPDGSLKESGYKVRKSNPNNFEENYDIIYGPLFKDNVVYTNISGNNILKTVFSEDKTLTRIKK